MEKLEITLDYILKNEKFQKFLHDYQLPLEIFNGNSIDRLILEIPRYIRKTFKCSKSEEIFLNELEGKAIQDKFLNVMYSLPSAMKIASLEIYKNGEIAGIDLSSAYVVFALRPKSDENIMELCCAPGAKLCFTAEIMKLNSPYTKGSLTGLDISSDRLNICKNLLKKYGFERVTLINEDGVSFKCKELFDKILLDAECTHDGSLKHIIKYVNRISNPIIASNKRKSNSLENESDYFGKRTKKNEWTIEDFEERFLDSKKLENIIQLQKGLLENAFSLLKEGKYLIYSTCSFSKFQNEYLIKQFIEDKKGEAILQDVFEKDELEKIPCKFDTENGWARFDPILSKSGGMFIAKIKKLSKNLNIV